MRKRRPACARTLREKPHLSAQLHQILVSRRVGGAAQVALGLARAALERGWPGLTWVPGPGPASERVAREGLPHRVMSLEIAHPTNARRLVTCAHLAAKLTAVQPALVHVHSAWMFGLVWPALRIARARTIVHFQLDPDEEEIRWTLKHPPAHIITCAHYIARRIRSDVERLGLKTSVTAAPNAIDLERFVPGDRLAARRETAITSPDRFVILTFGNLSPHKGQATAIRALHHLAAQGVPAELWIAGEDRSGDGNYERELRQLARELNVADHVRFLGFRSDTPRLLQSADVFVLPSQREGLPISVLEAQAAGVPVIGSEIPGMTEIIEDGTTGFIVRSDDAAGYADRLTLLHRQTDLAGRLRAAATARVRSEYGWATFEQRVFDVYQDLDGHVRSETEA